LGAHIKINAKNAKDIYWYDESKALVVGISDYKGEALPLPGVVNDVAEVKKVLEKTHGFQVDVLMNPTRKDFNEAIDKLIGHKWSNNSRVLVYIAGHGHTRPKDGMGYIVPVDAPNPLRDEDLFKAKAISMEQIKLYASDIGAKHVLFVFDSCFSGSVFRVLRKLVPDEISEAISQPVKEFMTAGTANQPVPDKSIFREKFIKGLEGAADLTKDGYVTGSELGIFLALSVTTESGGSQTPQYGKINNPELDKGDFVFVLKDQKEKPPNDCTLHYQRGVVLLNGKEYPEAESSFKEATKCDPDNAKAHYNLGVTQINQDKHKDAVTSFIKVITLKPDDKLKSKAYFNLGVCQENQREYKQALDSYEKALELDRTNTKAKVNSDRVRASLKE
jgi:tetratricopeptide (TPR) repeat protein